MNIQFVPIGVSTDVKEKLRLRKLEVSAKLKKEMTYGEVIDYLLKK